MGFFDRSLHFASSYKSTNPTSQSLQGRFFVTTFTDVSRNMKLAAITLLLILLVNCELGNSQGGPRVKVLRMCISRFSNCQSRTKYKRNFGAGAKCCGRAWTVCQLHRFSCLKICYPYYRSCMCSFGFKFYCWFCSIKRLETTVHTPPSTLFRSRNFNLSCILLLCQSSKAFHLSIFRQSLYCLLLIK